MIFLSLFLVFYNFFFATTKKPALSSDQHLYVNYQAIGANFCAVYQNGIKKAIGINAYFFGPHAFFETQCYGSHFSTVAIGLFRSGQSMPSSLTICWVLSSSFTTIASPLVTPITFALKLSLAGKRAKRKSIHKVFITLNFLQMKL